MFTLLWPFCWPMHSGTRQKKCGKFRARIWPSGDPKKVKNGLKWLEMHFKHMVPEIQKIHLVLLWAHPPEGRVQTRRWWGLILITADITLPLLRHIHKYDATAHHRCNISSIRWSPFYGVHDACCRDHVFHFGNLIIIRCQFEACFRIPEQFFPGGMFKIPHLFPNLTCRRMIVWF